MNHQIRLILWHISTFFLGIALPTVLMGRAVMFACLGVGILTGLIATKGASLRGTVRILTSAKLMWLLCAIYVVLLLSSLVGINPDHSMAKMQDMVAVAAAGIALFFTLREMPGEQVERLTTTLVIATCVMLAVALIDAVVAWPWLSEILHRDKALTTHRLNFLSSVIAVLAPFVWAKMLIAAQEREVWAQRLVWPMGVLTIMMVLVCGGRAGWLAMGVAVVLFVWQAGKHHHLILHRRHWLLGICAGALGLLGYGYSRGWEYLWERMNLWAGSRGFGGGRGEIWQVAWNHIGDNWLVGIGPQGFRYLPEQADFHPHNFILQLLLETGLIGFALVMAAIIWITASFASYAKHNLYGLAAFCSLIAFWTASLANTSVFNIWWLTFFVFMAIFGWRVGWSGGTPLQKVGTILQRFKAPFSRGGSV